MLDASQPPVEQEPEEGDPSPCPEDEEVFVRPDVAAMEQAIGKFLDGLEGQERRGFERRPSEEDSGGLRSRRATVASANSCELEEEEDP